MEIVKRVFLSHIHEEKDVALALQDLIRAQLDQSIGGKVECFLSSDKWQQRPGEDWIGRIKKELSQANIVVLMLSPQSLSRHWVNLEAGAAWIMEKTIIPAIYSGLKIASVPRPYSDRTVADLEEDPFQLLHEIGRELFYPPPLPPNHEANERLRKALDINRERLSALR